MTDPNPYSAPAAKVADRDRAAASPVKGVIYGVLVDILGTTAASAALGLAYGIYLATSGMSMEEIQQASTQIDPTSTIGFIGAVVGCAFSVLGGYLCARVAGQPEMKWAAVMGAISAVFGLLMGLQGYSLELNIFMNAIAFGMVMLGGYLGARRNAAKA